MTCGDGPSVGGMSSPLGLQNEGRGSLLFRNPNAAIELP